MFYVFLVGTNDILCISQLKRASASKIDKRNVLNLRAGRNGNGITVQLSSRAQDQE